MVYDIGSVSDKLFFVAKGEFANGVVFDLKNYHKYPVGKKEWEVLVTTRKLMKTVETYKSGSVFGQLELSYGVYGVARRTQVSAICKGKVFCIPFETYLECILSEANLSQLDFDSVARERLAKRLETPEVDQAFQDELHEAECARKDRVPFASKRTGSRAARCWMR